MIIWVSVKIPHFWADALDGRLGRPSWFQRVCWYESWRLLRKKEVQAAGITIPGAYKESFQVAIQQRITEIVYELLRIYAYLVFTFELLHLVDSAGLLGLAAALTWSLKDQINVNLHHVECFPDEFHWECIKLTFPTPLALDIPGWHDCWSPPLTVACAFACRVSSTFLRLGLGGIDSLCLGISVW